MAEALHVPLSCCASLGHVVERRQLILEVLLFVHLQIVGLQVPSGDEVLVLESEVAVAFAVLQH